MRIFVAESICGGGMHATPLAEIPPCLRSEGRMMWQAITFDLASWSEIVTPVDPRFDLPRTLPNAEFIEMDLSEPPWQQWLGQARQCDAAIIIAPETNGQLNKAINVLRAGGVRVLAPSQEALRITSDKWLTAKWLHKNDIPHCPTWAAGIARPIGDLSSELAANSGSNRWLIKPRDGCASQQIRLEIDFDHAHRSLQPNEILQPLLPGRPASVVVLGCIQSGIQNLLPAVWQTVDGNDMHYQGGTGPVDAEHQSRAASLARQVAQALPGDFSGFLGIDLLLGDETSQDAVIEINPRLTTSYLGVRQMTGENLSRRLFVPLQYPPVITAGVESVVWQT